MKVVVINGYPCAGKTTFSDICCEISYPYGKNLSTVDFVKDIARQCGWNGEKTLKNRKFLSDLKTLLTNWNEVPLQKLREDMEKHRTDLCFLGFDPNKAIFFVQCREPSEIQKLVDTFGAITVYVQRDKIESQQLSNASDEKVRDFHYDVTIENNGTLCDLEKTANGFFNLLEDFYKYQIPRSKIKKYKCCNQNCVKGFEVSCLGCQDFIGEEDNKCKK